MAYSSWSVVFGEQPSAAKWNILGTNDASFNDGTGISNDVITDTKLIYGKIRSRQGGSATNWYTAGTNTYDYSATNVFMQVGSTEYDGAGTDTVTFPTAFSQVPMVIANVITAVDANTYSRISNITATTFEFQVFVNSSTSNAERIGWLAIGQ